MAKQFNIFGDIVANESDRWFERVWKRYMEENR